MIQDEPEPDEPPRGAVTTGAGNFNIQHELLELAALVGGPRKPSCQSEEALPHDSEEAVEVIICKTVLLLNIYCPLFVYLRSSEEKYFLCVKIYID